MVSEQVEAVDPGIEPTPGVYEDWNVITTNAGITYTQYKLVVTPLYTSGADIEVVSFESLDTDVCTIEDLGLGECITRFNGSEGGTTQVEVTCTTNNFEVKRKTPELNFELNESDTTYTRISPRDNTFRKNVTDAIDQRIQGKNPTSSKPLYTNNNWSTRNTDCWAYGIDLTCASPWNSRNGNRRTLTLVTPRHALGTPHYALAVGDTVRFVGLDNTSITRTIIGRRISPDYSGPVFYNSDICIYTLDSDVPSGFTFAKVLPTDWIDYIPTGIKEMPVLYLDQEEKALVADAYQFNVDRFYLVKPPNTSPRLPFYETLIQGDSGNPMFFIVNGEPVLLTVFTFANAGTFTTPNMGLINQMIEDSDLNAGITPTGYSLTTCDLSPFMSFS